MFWGLKVTIHRYLKCTRTVSQACLQETVRCVLDVWSQELHHMSEKQSALSAAFANVGGVSVDSNFLT